MCQLTLHILGQISFALIWINRFNYREHEFNCKYCYGNQFIKPLNSTKNVDLNFGRTLLSIVQLTIK